MPYATSSQVKLALGIAPANTDKDALIAQVLPAVDGAIDNYTHRTFALYNGTDPATMREFPVEESGFTTVDDFVQGSVTGIVAVAPGGVLTTLTANDYVAQPAAEEFEVGWYIETRPFGGTSPEMGFTRNLDVLWPKYGTLLPSYLRVTAKWGWPAVPGPIMQAAVWTAVSFIDNPRPYVSEAIQGYSRTMATPLLEAIPARARDLLGPYTKG
jgi:hypothetical protein